MAYSKVNKAKKQNGKAANTVKINSKSKPQHFGLYGEHEFLLPDFLHCEDMAYRSHKHNWNIAPHLHTNLLQVFFIESGNVDFYFEIDTYKIQSQAIVIISESITHGLQVNRNIKGLVLTVSTSYLETIFNTSPNLLLKLNELCVLTELENENLFLACKDLIYKLAKELKEVLPESGLVIQGYLNLFFANIFRIILNKNSSKTNSYSSQTKYFRDFYSNVKKSYTPMKSIKAYALELKISPVHLNRICNATTGKSALQLVQEFLFIEAEKYLKHTEYRVSEIAYRLNFEDPAYFSRFFRKYAGISPKQYRDKL